MFDVYFCPRVVRRLRARPLTTVLESFLIYLHHRGHTRNTIQTYIRAAELFTVWLRRRRRSLASINEADVRSFACQQRPGQRPCANSQAALRRLLRHLRDEGLAHPRPTTVKPAVERLIAQYDAHLRDVAGLAPATRLYRRRYALEFIQFVFGARLVRWTRVRPHHVRAFIARYGQNGRVAAAQVAAGSLRSFLRWLQFHGRTNRDLVATIPRFPRWRLASLPNVMTDAQLHAFLATFDRSTPTGRRDCAMALCMVDLGLRVSEVACLAIDDFEEASSTLRLVGGKSRRDRVLPLPRRVRQAVTTYIRRDRPKTDDRHLFLRHRLPFGVAITRELVRGMIRRAYAAVPGCQRWTGTHVLRHTAATRLHRAGADVKRVADILGHQSIDTTAIYTKVDLPRLREVALPWPVVKEVQS